MIIALTGASGFIGRHLTKLLMQHGHSVRILSRHAGTNAPAGVKVYAWKPDAGLAPAESLQGADAVVHLAGEPVAQRWTAEVKRRIRESRVTGTRNLVQSIAALDRRPPILISASATGYYGNRGETAVDESAPPGDGFLSEVCVAWEREAVAAKDLGLRVAIIRTGIVLHPGGGALHKMLPPFRLGIGGRLGDGRQWTPWVHIEDLIGLYVHVLESSAEGPLNGVAPNPVTNAEFTRSLAHTLHRPAIFPVPQFALRLIFGEMATALFYSERVLPHRAEASGYQFRFPQIGAALEDLLKP